jgi:5-methylcytosine-specific restriction protein A
MSIKTEITPRQRLLVMNLAREAGIDVSDWADVKGGKAKAAANPKYCYEWAFVQPGVMAVLNLWLEQIVEEDGEAFRDFNFIKFETERTEAIHRRRANAMARAIEAAWTNGLPVRVIVLDGRRRDINNPELGSAVKSRLLDPVAWAVIAFDRRSGECSLLRGALSGRPNEAREIELEGFERAARLRFILHRRREAKLRQGKIREVLKANDGKLVCEVRNCGFDFSARYGQLGSGYAQVHHKEPLSDAPPQGRRVTLQDLAIVCANCHVMIHRGGECRALDDLVPS